MKHDDRVVCRASFADAPVTLRAVGADQTISNARRDELLAMVRDGKHLELELDIMPFRQKVGERNRNNVRFREGSLLALGRSGRGLPFLKDHHQTDIDAVGGEVVASRMERSEDGTEYQLHQTVRLKDPWANEKALRGLIKHLSIAWAPTGPVHCLACKADYQNCLHRPGEVLDDGRVVEFEYQDAELVETSIVAVPAVKGTSVDTIRAALSAAAENNRGKPQRNGNMERVVSVLGLAATAGESEIVGAVETLRKRSDGLEKELAIADAERHLLQAKVDEYEKDARHREENEFVASALSSGRIDAGEEGMWRDFYRADSARASERLAERKVGTRTPVGLPRQSAAAPPTESPVAERLGHLIAAHGGQLEGIAHVLRQLGHANPDEAIAKHLAPVEH